jgi:hypothetical protein
VFEKAQHRKENGTNGGVKASWLAGSLSILRIPENKCYEGLPDIPDRLRIILCFLQRTSLQTFVLSTRTLLLRNTTIVELRRHCV